jgi:hypothetical protein
MPGAGGLLPARDLGRARLVCTALRDALGADAVWRPVCEQHHFRQRTTTRAWRCWRACGAVAPHVIIVIRTGSRSTHTTPSAPRRYLAVRRSTGMRTVLTMAPLLAMAT